MRVAWLAAMALAGVGCQRLVVRTDSKVALDGPVEARVTADLPPVGTSAPVRPVVVIPGDPAVRVAVLDVDGLLLNTPFVGPSSAGENPVAAFREKLDAAEADPCVRAVVLRVNSPGGGVAAAAAMRRDLVRFRARTGRPVVACVLDLGTGAAYHLASAADVVVVGPETVAGGVGVVLNLFNLRDLMAQFNVVPQPIKAGEYTDLGSSARPLKEEERAMLQGMADEFHRRLQADVRQSRPRVDSTGAAFDGRLFTGTQAVARGLADRVGDLDDAITLAGQLGRPDAATRPEVVLYRRPNDPAHSVYAVTANVPLQGAGFLPSIPGLDRSKLPTFLSLWQPELTTEKLGGK